jgi:hypothetical protein
LLQVVVVGAMMWVVAVEQVALELPLRLRFLQGLPLQ